MAASHAIASDVSLLCDLDAEIANCAFNPRMSKQELNSAQIAGTLVDQHRFRTSQRVSAELGRIEPETALNHAERQSRMLPVRAVVRS